MKSFTSLIFLAAPLLTGRAAASLNCTVTGSELEYFTCPDDTCDIAGAYKVGDIAEVACGADGTEAPDRWLYHYNGFYTPSADSLQDCLFHGTPFDSVDVLPFCSDDEYVPAPPQCTCHVDGSPTPTATPLTFKKRW
ncbi:hypothetical protein FQN54_008409 [Arachnomyces sp. PD_36]|nr:hypothetical protein FQN54_008409 [Arachnomyces sp. PD_36]